MKSLTRYTKKRFKRINRLLNSFPESQDQEVLHRIRLEIKKIKTLLHLVHYHNKRFKEQPSFIPFRSIFRDCNKIREPQVLHSLIVKYTEDRYLPKDDTATFSQRFINNIPMHLKNIKKKGQLILKKIKKVKSSTYHLYLKKKQKELRNVSSASTITDLHSYRKLIKEIFYLLSINNENRSINPFFKETATLIGDWHDKSIVIQKLRKKRPLQTDLIKKLQHEKRADITILKKRIKMFYN